MQELVSVSSYKELSKLDALKDDARLSQRERTVLLLAAEGLTDKEIAGNLGLSLKTVHTYWDRMRQKFNASTRTQVFAKFLRIELSGNSTDRLYHLFSGWEEGVWIVNELQGTIYANARLVEMLGLTSNEFAALTAIQVLNRVDAAGLAPVVTEAGSAIKSMEAPITRPDGKRLWLQFAATPWNDVRGNPKAIVLLVHDLTAEKRVEHALKSCEVALEGLFEFSSDAIARFDENLICAYVNRRLAEVAARSSEDIVGRPIGDLKALFSPHDLWSRSLEQVLQTGEGRHIEPDRECPLGTTWLFPEPSAELNPISIISVSRCAL